MNFLEISSEDKILSLFAVGKKDQVQKINYLLMITKDGIIKKTPLKEFENVRKSGLIAITLKKGDLLRKVAKSTGEDEVIVVTKKGQAIKFKEKEIRPMGRTAAGVRAIRLRKGDEVIGMEVIQKEKASQKTKTKEYLLVITEQGYGKKTELKEYRLQSRGGSGIKAGKITNKTGDIVGIKVLTGREEDLVVISKRGQVIRIKISQIPRLSRATQGVRIMRLEEGDSIASFDCL